MIYVTAIGNLPTPRTDDEAFMAQDRNGAIGECVTAKFARKLERELIGRSQGNVQPVCWLLTMNGRPEFSEGCVARTREELLADWPEAEGYGAMPLFTSTPISRANTHGNGVEP